MSIYVVGSTKNLFLEGDDIREKFLVDVYHDGDNIDHLNPWYCELTGLYYLWKNSTAKFVGLEHYRRFFASPSKTKRRMSKEEIEDILAKHDIITCRFRHHPKVTGFSSGYDWFQKAGPADDFNAFIDIMNGKFNGLGDKIADYTQESELVQCNMFVSTKAVVDEYCEWLFPKLAAFDKYYGISDKNRRIDGYLAEHIFGLWIRQQRLRNYTATKVEMHFLPMSGYKA
jgi:hypothetical protein